MTNPLTVRTRGLIVAELARQRDLDLPVAQRPSRTEAGIIKGATIPLRYGGPLVEVMGPGRGVGWIYVGWVDNEGGAVLGQLHKDRLRAPVIPVVTLPGARP